MLLFTNLACANTCYLQNGRLYIYDEAHYQNLGVYGNGDDVYYYILETLNGVAYAGGRGGYIIVDISNAEIIVENNSGGYAGEVHSMAVSKKCLAFGYDSMTILYDNSNKYHPVWAAKIDTTSLGDSTEIKNNILYIGYSKYEISDIYNPRYITPGAYVAIYDNKGTWATEQIMSGIGTEVIGFGWSGTEPIIGDWNGDGFKEVGIYNRAGNNFLIPYDNDEGYYIVGLGWKGVTPVVGDFDGDNEDDVGVYDNKGTWALDTFPSTTIVGFGWAGTEPVVGDWNGDGVDEVGLYNRPGNNFLIPRDSSYYVVGLGWEGVIPIVGNWDSDINDEVGVYAPDTSAFALAGKTPFTFGKSGSQPVVGDVDFNGITEVGVCEPDGTIKYKTDEPYYVGLIKWEGSTLIGC